MAWHCKKLYLLNRQRVPVLLMFVLFIGSADSYCQSLSFSFKKVPLEKVFRDIEGKVEQRFVYTREMMNASKPVTLEVKNASINKVLDLVFADQPLLYSFDHEFIKVRFRPEPVVTAPVVIDIRGRVVDEKNLGIEGATVMAIKSHLATATNDEGYFNLNGVDERDVLVVTSIGYLKKEVAIEGRSVLNIVLDLTASSLDETVVMAYGSTTRRLNTGNISKVTGQDIQTQPVSNVLAALEGRVPGMTVSQSSGIPGGAIKVQIRGQNSILQGSDPLFIIDGVPFAAGNNPINIVTNSAGSSGLSPLNTIDPSMIESIEVLKDADATAIYGSRGANGVILITTKKGNVGKTVTRVHFSQGWSRITRTMDMLNTKQYLVMRREAFANDGVVPSATNAPDLFLWDTTRYTNFKKLLIGGVAKTMDGQVSINGGSEQLNFFMGGSFRRETTVFPGDLSDKRANFQTSINYKSPDRKLGLSVLVGYGYEQNNLVATDLTGYINMPPHVVLYDTSGNLNWKQAGTPFRNLFGINPLSVLKRKYNGEFQNLNSNLDISYRLAKGLVFKSNIGYNTLNGDEVLVNPKTSIDPASTALAFSNFGDNSLKTWIIEPRIEYDRRIGNGKLNILAGGTLQDYLTKTISINANNYTNDALLYSISGAGLVTTNNNSSRYRYAAAYGRINYNLYSRYLVNLSGRRDGSSRFGPGSRFNNFWAAGLGWIFSGERWMKDKQSFISYGKLRFSYGITGNDQIGDYQFLDTWSSSIPQTYQNVPGLRPTRLFNPDYSWEENKKLEGGLELGFLKDRILLAISYYRNISGNQLINYSLPMQTGFNSVLKNLDAKVENRGWEYVVSSENISKRNFSWKTNANLTIPHNELVSFPGLSTSSYSNIYTIGQPLSGRRTYRYLGIDDATGVYTFQDYDGNGLMNNLDKFVVMNTFPSFFGGVQNTLQFKRLELNLFFEFRKQLGRNYLSTMGYNVPGYGYSNQPEVVLGRWQKSGDPVKIQKFTQNFSSPAFTAASNYMIAADAIFSDASFIRCKNVSLGYNLLKPTRHIEEIRLFVQGQNLFVVTNYEGADPENQNLYVLPPLRIIAAGISIQL